MEEDVRSPDPAAEPCPVDPPVPDVPDDRDAESLEPLGAFVPVSLDPLERGEKPVEIPVGVGLDRPQPLEVRHVGVLERLLLEEGQEAGKESAEPVGARVTRSEERR